MCTRVWRVETVAIAAQNQLVFSGRRRTGHVQKIFREEEMAKKLDGMLATHFLTSKECPKCNETIFVAEGATLVPRAVEFHWRCEQCDHAFATIQPFEIVAA